MKSNIYFIVDSKEVYYKMLAEAISDELKEIYPETKYGYISTIKDIFKADLIIICGDGEYHRGLLWTLNVFKKPLILYHVLSDTAYFNRLAKRADWIVSPRVIEGYDYYPSPVLLGDLATPRHIERIWSRERLVSKRGCIGVTGFILEEDMRQKFVDALNFLIEDLDLNVVFLPILKEESVKDILSGLRYSANTRYVQTDKYSSKEILGIMSKLDILITTGEKGVLCSMAANRPIVGLMINDELQQFLGDITEEEILFDIDKLSSDKLYSKIKISWVHRDSIAEQMQNRISELKNKAEEGIKRLGKEFIE